MIVNPRDGSCRECGGQLEIIDVDDATMNVQCTDCGENYDVETDAFGDGCLTYYVPLMSKKLLGEADEPDDGAA